MQVVEVGSNFYFIVFDFKSVIDNFEEVMYCFDLVNDGVLVLLN